MSKLQNKNKQILLNYSELAEKSMRQYSLPPTYTNLRIMRVRRSKYNGKRLKSKRQTVQRSTKPHDE